MKTQLLLFFFFISSLTLIAQQPYTPFPLRDVRWNISTYSFSSGCLCSYYYDGDTIVQNYKYSKLYSNCICSDDILHTSSGSHHILSGLIREEGKKVYEIIGNEEKLIFDFGLNIGDTVPIAYFPHSTNRLVVEKIDSIQLLDNSYRKRYRAGVPNNSNFYNEFIEGIGALKTFRTIAPISGSIIDFGSTLQCFTQGNKILYSKYNTSSCELVTPTVELNEEIIRLSSNVLSSPIELTWANQWLNISIYNSLGQLIYNAKNGIILKNSW